MANISINTSGFPKDFGFILMTLCTLISMKSPESKYCSERHRFLENSLILLESERDPLIDMSRYCCYLNN